MVPAVLIQKQKKGKEKIVPFPKAPCGHRDFYHWTDCKIRHRLEDIHTDIKTIKLGIGSIKVVSARELYEKTMRVIKKEPTIFLCDRKECEFCNKWKKIVEKRKVMDIISKASLKTDAASRR